MKKLLSTLGCLTLGMILLTSCNHVRATDPFISALNMQNMTASKLERAIKDGINVNYVDDSNFTPIMYLVQANKPNLKVIEVLLKHGANINAISTSMMSPLMQALFMGYHVKTAELLINHGADVNIKDDSGYTAFRYAHIYNNDFKMSEMLLKHGSKPTAEDLEYLKETCDEPSSKCSMNKLQDLIDKYNN